MLRCAYDNILRIATCLYFGNAGRCFQVSPSINEVEGVSTVKTYTQKEKVENA